MSDAVLYLLLHSTRNWIRGIGRRLRSPRYALAILIGVAYLWLFIVGQRHSAGASMPSGTVALGGSLILCALVAKWWLFGADRLALAFTPAEIQFLFPAPVTRTALLGYKLLRAQRMILANVLIWLFLLRRGGGPHLGPIPYAVTMWVFFSTLFFHRLGVALTRDTITEHGRAGFRRAWPILLGLGLVATATILTVHRLPREALAIDRVGTLDAINTLLATPPLGWLLWPFRIPLGPLDALGMGDWMARLLPALALLGLHVVWVVRADRGFQDAAIEASARREELLQRWRRQGTAAAAPVRRRRSWPRLKAEGHPVGAIVWKNVTRLVRTVSPAFLTTMLVIVVITMVLGLSERADRPQMLIAIGTVALGWAGALAILGPQWVRNDLRGDLDHLPLLRTWPISGAVLMTGEILSSALVLTLLEIVLGGLGLAALWFSEGVDLPAGQTAAFGVVALVLLGALNLMSLAIQNGAALLFPGWVRTEIRPGGVEQMGQQLLTAGVSILLLALAVLGPAVLGAAVGYLLEPLLGRWALVPAGIVAAAGLGLELFLLFDWLGTRFERTDPAAQ